MLDHRIYTFLTLYQEMNYRKTAELLNMTQPGVTQHIQYLERAYGVKLFVYDGKRLHRTAAAEALNKRIHAILQEEQELLADFAKEETLLLRVGATKTVGEFMLRDQVSQFLAQEGHALELLVDNTQALLTALDGGKLDFAILEGVFDKTRYAHRLFCRENFVGVCAKSHPFANQVVTWDQVLCEKLILREPGSGTRGIFEQLLASSGYSLASFPAVSSVSSFRLLRQLVAAGLGITFAYQAVAEGDEGLACFELKDVSTVRELHYVYTNEKIGREKIGLFTPD